MLPGTNTNHIREDTMTRALLLMFLSLAALLPPLPAWGEVDANILRTLKTDGKPLDIEVSADGARIFVLVDGGRILIYSAAGALEETLELDGPADSIALSAKSDLLYAVSEAGGTVQVLRLEFVQKISYEGSPTKGLQNAPVAIAVFNDFQ
jgi:hypothetical protein